MSEHPMQVDISYATTGELLDELKKRFTVVMVAYMNTLDDQREEANVMWRGGCYSALGLIKRAEHLVQMQLDSNEVFGEVPDEPDQL